MEILQQKLEAFTFKQVNDFGRGKISVDKYRFCYSNVSTTETKDPLFSTAKEALVGAVMTIGDVNDILTISELQ